MLQPELYLMTSYEAIPKLLIYITERKGKKEKWLLLGWDGSLGEKRYMYMYG